MNQEILSNQQQVQTFGDISMGDGNIITITQTIQISTSAIQTRPLNSTSPYKRLKRFEPRDKDLFFGRDQLIASLIKAISQSNLLLLLGASGSGKSSVVRAGLIPQLSELIGTNFCDFTLTPDKNPFDSLRASLIYKGYKQEEAEIALTGNSDTITKVVQYLKEDKAQWLLFIDQFEEIFTLCQDTEKRNNFIESIVKIAKSQNSSVKIVMAMRADFLDKFSPYPDLWRIAGNNIQLMTDLQSELRLVVEQPAAKHGVVFEQGLVEEIIKDVQGQAGYLPLLQYTLDLLWQSDDLTDRTLNVKTYRKLGGVRGALQKHVNEIYDNKLSQEEQKEAKQIFLRLVDIISSIEDVNLAGRTVSRRAYLSNFADTSLVKNTLKKLIDNNLLVSNREVSNRAKQPTVEIVHEALINSWQKLKSWIEESKEVIIINNRLSDDAQRWKNLLEKEQIKAEAELWSGTKLEQVLEIKKEKLFELTLGGLSEDEEKFITASVELRDRLARQEKNRNLWRNLAAIAIIASVVFAWQQRQYFQQAFDTVLINADTLTPESVDRLQSLLNDAKIFRDKVDKFKYQRGTQQSLTYYRDNQDELNKSFAYYRNILTKTIKYQYQITENPNLSNYKKTIYGISKNAETSLAQMLDTYRIPDLKLKLEQRNFGYTDALATEHKNQFTALQTTYEILMRDAGADVDGNSRLTGQEEADQMPCFILKEIQQLWQEIPEKFEQGSCSWYKSNSDFFDLDCKALENNTIGFSVFDNDVGHVVDRIKQCQDMGKW